MKDAEQEAAVEAAAGVESGKKPQKGAADSGVKKKPGTTVPPIKSGDKQAAVSIPNSYQYEIPFSSLKAAKPAPLDTSTTKSLAEWAAFVPSDELLQAFNLPQANQRGFSKSTISKPVGRLSVIDLRKNIIVVF